MTDKELIQALRCCNGKGGACSDCPRKEYGEELLDCVTHVNNEAIDRLEALLAENEQLSIELQAMQNAANGFKKMVPRWVSVSERLPESDGKYLVLTESGDVFEVEFNTYCGDNGEFGVTQVYYHPDTLGFLGSEWTSIDTVTHWMMFLPEPPSTEGVE